MALKTCSECGHEVSTGAKACPHCGKANPARRMRPLLVGGGVVLVCLTLAIVAGGRRRTATADRGQSANPPAIIRAGAVAPEAPAAVEEAPAREETPVAKLSGVATLSEAVEFVRPKMTDTTNDISPGTALLALWALQRMTFADVDVKRDETTFARVMKDPDEERGKRLCVTGSVIQIGVEKLPQGKLSSGLLMSYGGNIINFSGAGSSGDLVARSRARFCGVVIGRYSYNNSGGGVGHGIQVVGMFDITENNPNKKARRSYDDED